MEACGLLALRNSSCQLGHKKCLNSLIEDILGLKRKIPFHKKSAELAAGPWVIEKVYAAEMRYLSLPALISAIRVDTAKTKVGRSYRGYCLLPLMLASVRSRKDLVRLCWQNSGRAVCCSCQG
jgi:hypothetical protein